MYGHEKELYFFVLCHTEIICHDVNVEVFVMCDNFADFVPLVFIAQILVLDCLYVVNR